MVSPRPLQASIPIETEGVRRHRDLVTSSRYEEGQGLVVYLDVRRRNWCKQLKLHKGTRVRWVSARANAW